MNNCLLSSIYWSIKFQWIQFILFANNVMSMCFLYYGPVEWWMTWCTRALSLGVSNARYTIRCAKCQIFGIWHNKHQKSILIRYFKSQKFWHETTVQSQMWDSTDINVKIFFAYFIYFFSFLPIHISLFICNTYLSLSPSGSLITLSIPLSPHHAVLTTPLTTTPRCRASYHHTPPSFRTVTTSCYPPRHRIFLNWLVVVGFAFRFVWFGWVLLFGLFDLGWVCAGGGYWCCCGNDCWWPLLR